jgi:hypothetical protein
MSQLDPVVNGPSLYINGLALSNDATTPNTILDVAAGICRDSNNIVDMMIGNYLGVNTAISANTATVINFAVNGLNGLDIGTIAASTFYYIYVIADSSNKHPSGCLASLSATAPTLPFGYDSIRVIGCALTDGSSHLLSFYMSGTGNGRNFQWDAPIAVTVTASGTSTTYSAMDLSTGVPASKFGRVYLQYNYTCNAAGNSVKFQPAGGTGDAQTFLGQVASVALEDSFTILPLVVAAVPKVSYKVSAGTLNNVNVLSFDMNL